MIVVALRYINLPNWTAASAGEAKEESKQRVRRSDSRVL